MNVNTMNINYTAIDNQLEIWGFDINRICKGAKLAGKERSDAQIMKSVDRYAEAMQDAN